MFTCFIMMLMLSFAQAEDYIVTKTTKYSLVDRIAQELCNAERDDCYTDWQCGEHTCITIGGTGLTYVWTQYRDKARKALAAIKE